MGKICYNDNQLTSFKFRRWVNKDLVQKQLLQNVHKRWKLTTVKKICQRIKFNDVLHALCDSRLLMSCVSCSYNSVRLYMFALNHH